MPCGGFAPFSERLMAGAFQFPAFLLREAARWVKRHAGWVLTALVLSLGLGLALYPFDAALHNWLSRGQDPGLAALAVQISFWGDLPQVPFYLAVVVYLTGYFRRRPAWRRLAITCLLSGAIAAAIVLTIRAGVGRTRPISGLPDGFHGPSFAYNYNAFPSGHTGSAFGYATALTVICPPAGVPALLGAGAVAWSRMEVNAHRPLDVLGGAWVGIVCGLAFGRAYQRWNLLNALPLPATRGPPAPSSNAQS